MKYEANSLPTRKNLVMRGNSTQHTCPCCGSANETADQNFQCQNVDMKKTYNDEKDTIHKYSSSTTSIRIRNRILELLHNFWINQSAISSEVQHGDLAQKQHSLGTRAPLNGVWLKGRVREQNAFNKLMRNKMFPKIWHIRLTLLIQNFVHAM